MAKGFIPTNRDQGFLVPQFVDDWVPADHLVHMVLEAVRLLDTSVFHQRARLGGPGRAGHDPDKMLVLLILGYATGQVSSRRIERACITEVGFMYACGMHAPDHTCLSRFRAEHADAFQSVFADVLVLLADHGLVNPDTVAVDGTKMPANASLDANRSREWVREQAARIVAEAARVDEAEDALFGEQSRGDEPDPRVNDPQKRRRMVQQWCDELHKAEMAAASARRPDRAAQRQQDLAAGIPVPGRIYDPGQRLAQAKATLAAARKRQQAKIDEHARRRAAGLPTGRRRPTPVDDYSRVRRAQAAYDKALAVANSPTTSTPRARTEAATIQVNTTDPQSRIMKTRRGWVQGYNLQVAVSADGILLDLVLTQDHNDQHQAQPMINRARTVVRTLDRVGGTRRRIATVLLDAGYNNAANLTGPGPDRLIAQGKARTQARRELTTGAPDPSHSPAAQMQHRLDTERGRTLYKRRGATVEPAIGNLKKLQPHLTRRGLQACQSEIYITGIAYNLKKLHQHTTTTAHN